MCTFCGHDTYSTNSDKFHKLETKLFRSIKVDSPESSTRAHCGVTKLDELFELGRRRVGMPPRRMCASQARAVFALHRHSALASREPTHSIST